MKIDEWLANRFGEKLEVVVRKPEGDGIFPTIIFVTGFGANLHETNNSHDELSEYFVAHGFATIQFSFSGRGESEGDYEKMTLSRQVVQLDDVIEWTNKQSFCDTKRIGVYALSFGVATTIRATLDSISSLCLVGGVYSAYETIQKLFEDRGEFHPDQISWRKFSSGEVLKYPPDFWKDLKQSSETNKILKLTIPTMIVHGGCDSKISPKEAQSVFFSLKSEKKRLKIVAGGDHAIIDVPKDIREEFLYTVLEWFKETLIPTP